MKKIVFALFILSLISCTPKQQVVSEKEMLLGYASGSDKKVKVPASLVTKIESDYISLFRQLNPESPLSDVKVLEEVKKNFIELKMTLLKDPEHSVISDSTKFYLPRGGGVIDLESYLDDGPGYFSMKLGAKSQSGEDLDNLKSYFISNSKLRKGTETQLGSGCDKYFDLTNFVKKNLFANSLKLSTIENSHIGMLAGTFVFVDMQDGILNLGTLSIKDSRFPEAHCDI